MPQPSFVSAEFPVEAEEVVEACEILSRWRLRGAELPPVLRSMLDDIAADAAGGRKLIEVRVTSGVIFAELTPRVRNLVANLRARETAETGLLEGPIWT